MPKALLAGAFAALLVTLPWGDQAHAAVQRSFLLQSCTAHDQAKIAGCEAYFAGVLETVQLLQTDGAVKREVCVPERIELRQVREGVINYLQTHPASGSPATPGVLEAMRSLYHC
ncbi:MAG: hypothetical protein JO264_09465 [Acidisphaera sp.]|nr:hypothetical protein [Acidisphaera sp.]